MMSLIDGSLDSFVAALVMAAAGLPRALQRTLITLLGMADAAATLAGATLRGSSAGGAGSWCAMLAGLLVVLAVGVFLRCRHWAGLLLATPALCSLDNLVDALCGGASQASAVTTGIASALLAWLAFAMSNALRSRWQIRRKAPRVA